VFKKVVAEALLFDKEEVVVRQEKVYNPIDI
jgi:hypothetical protein